MQHLRSIPVTKITGNTQVHVDRHHDSGEPVEGKAAFIVLNENPHATFVHGSTDVHAKAGDLVVFDADVPHNTQVARGTLSLVGPVDLRRLTPVGLGCSDNQDCATPGSLVPICTCDPQITACPTPTPDQVTCPSFCGVCVSSSKGSKGSKRVKSPKSPKAPKSSKGSKGSTKAPTLAPYYPV